ncbi:MAG: carboxypeptidase-like regulatory domain-containing protein [Acidobacteriota bacterium]|nr:carboxypeptidase-like regulatory domain-containing protein [Acidobacteriota bacterium]
MTSAATTGAYTFAGVPAGRTYVITPASNVYTFTPASRTLSGLSSSQAGQNFTASARKTYSISGRVARAGTTTGIAGVVMTLTNGSTGAVVRTMTTGSNGAYSLTAIPAGITYVLRPAKSGVTFSPASRTYANLSANQPSGANTGFFGP